MTLYDDSTAHELDSATSASAVSEQSAVSTEGSAPSTPTTQPEGASTLAQEEKPVMSTAVIEEKPPVSTATPEDFASALETFTTEAEESVGEDRVIKGTVLKLTGTHVVVDIGAKSEGMLPLEIGRAHV